MVIKRDIKQQTATQKANERVEQYKLNEVVQGYLNKHILKFDEKTQLTLRKCAAGILKIGEIHKDTPPEYLITRKKR